MKYAVHDRGTRLCRTASGELALRGEGNAGDPRAAIAGSLSDQQDRGIGVCIEIVDEPPTSQLRAFALAIEVERPPDAGRGETLDEKLGVP